METMTATSAATEALVYHLVEAIYNVVEHTDAHISGILDELKLTRPLSDALWVLDPDGPPIPMGALAVKLRCEPSTATFLVDKLIEKELVQRGSDAHDRRKTTVVLTQSGRDTRKRLVRAVMNASPVIKLPDEDLVVLVKLLEKALVGTRPKYRM
jgi:DNA-binding MarR family transcriptional regulator